MHRIRPRLPGAALAAVAVLAAPPSPAPAAAAAPAAPAAVTETFAARPGTRLPFLHRNNHILVRGTVGASDSLWFIVDTGAGANVLDTGTARRLGLAVDSGVEAHGAGGMVPAGRVRGAAIRIPGAVMADSMVVAIALDDIALRTGHPCHGILGVPFWRGNVVEVDYARSELVLHDPAAWRHEGTGAELPLRFERGHPYVTGSVTLPGGEPIAGRFVIDTGSTMALILTPAFVERHRPLDRVARTLEMQLGGVGGRSRSPLGRIERLTLGPYAVEKPLAIFRQPGPGVTAAGDALGNIGGDILRRFRVIFDYARERMILEPATAFAEPFETDMSGVVLSVRDDGSNAIEVAIVQEDSPAAEAGIHPGDVLEALDGQPVKPAALVELRRGLRQEGRSVRLRLRRDGEVLDRVLVTRRLL